MEEKTKIQGDALFNLKAFEDEKPLVYVVEGEIDATSLFQEGLPAVSLNSTSNDGKLIDYLKENPTNKTLYLALDNDKAGIDTTNKLKTALEGLQVPFEVVEIPKPYNDPNELYTADRELFKSYFSNPLLHKLKARASGNTVSLFLQESNKQKVLIPTGLKKLDKILNGGLSNELYTIGATPASGKSALMEWIACNLSKAGNPVIYYSLEMSELEIQARGLSRLTYELSPKRSKDKEQDAKTQGDILRHYNSFSNEDKALLDKCIAEYKEIAQNLYIITPQTPYLEQIVTSARSVKNILGKSPVLIVDYLQLVQVDPKLKINDVKSRIDVIVQTLKSLTLSDNMPVILISSLNRAGYRGAVSMEDFKESGIIEFSSNVILGFYFTGIKGFKGNDEAYNEKLNELKKENPRMMTINVLKNRSGESGGEVYLNYYSKYNRFTEIDLTYER